MTPVVHGHASSRYDKPPSTLADQVARAVDVDEANLLSWTEVGDPDRAAKLKADGWGSFTPHKKTDVAWMWRKSVWDLVEKHVKELTPKTWTDGQGHKHWTRCATVVLDGPQGRLWASVAHLPSGVQDGNKFDADHPAKVAAWKDAVRGWADYHQRQVDNWRPDLTMYVADWNVDFHSGHWRDWVQGVFPKMVLTWKGDMPAGGTHGDRLIDATWATRNGRCVLLDKRSGTSDHRPYAEKIGWG